MIMIFNDEAKLNIIFRKTYFFGYFSHKISHLGR